MEAPVTISCRLSIFGKYNLATCRYLLERDLNLASRTCVYNTK
jgi:hypothetical protein